MRAFQPARHLEYDGSGGLDLFAREQRPLGKHKMHARRLHAVERAHRAGEFAFKRAQVIDVLHEARGSEHVRLVEDFVSDAAALGQAAFGELHAQPGHLIALHQHGAAVRLDLEGDGLPLKFLDDGAGVPGRKIREQRRHDGRRRAHDHEGKEGHEQGRHGRHGGEARRAKGLEEFEDTLHRDPPRTLRTRPLGNYFPPAWLRIG